MVSMGGIIMRGRLGDIYGLYIHILSKMPVDSLPDFLAHGPIFFASTP